MNHHPNVQHTSTLRADAVRRHKIFNSALSVCRGQGFRVFHRWLPSRGGSWMERHAVHVKAAPEAAGGLMAAQLRPADRDGAAAAAAPPPAPWDSGSLAFSCPAQDPLYDVRMLQHKNRSTETLLLARDARIQSLLACCQSHGLAVPEEVAAVANTASDTADGYATAALHDLLEQHHSSIEDFHSRLVSRNKALMALCRAKNKQIWALEAALKDANIRLPHWRFDTSSSSSSSSSGSSSVSSPEGSMDRLVPGGLPALLEHNMDRLKVHFNVKCVTSPGDSVWLVGNHPALGSWGTDNGQALKLKWTPGHQWQGDLLLGSKDDLLLSFKAVLRRSSSGQLHWQPGPNRELVLSRLMGYSDKEPLVATMDFYQYVDVLPLNYADACIKACKQLLGSSPDCSSEAAARKAAEAAVDAVIRKWREQQQVAAVMA